MPVRPAREGDLDALVELFAAARARQAPMAPVLWNPAGDARARHRPFLSYLLSADSAVALVSGVAGSGDETVDGALVAVRRPEGWLIDDFAVSDPVALPTVGRDLLAAALARIGPPVAAVAPAGDRSKAGLLQAEGFAVREQWWVARAGSGDLDPADLELDLISAPPVYDPGGPVAMLGRWDGSLDAARAARARAHDSGAVLVIAPTPMGDLPRERSLRAAGYAVASQWWARPS